MAAHQAPLSLGFSRQEYWLLLLLSRFSRVRLCVTPEMAAHWAPPSLGFSRQEHWSVLLQCMKVKSESEVAQSCPTLCGSGDADIENRLVNTVGEGEGGMN